MPYFPQLSGKKSKYENTNKLKLPITRHHTEMNTVISKEKYTGKKRGSQIFYMFCLEIYIFVDIFLCQVILSKFEVKLKKV